MDNSAFAAIVVVKIKVDGGATGGRMQAKQAP
jgi:hypothetical protein